MTQLQKIDPQDCSDTGIRQLYLEQGEVQKLTKLVADNVAGLHSIADAQKRLAQQYKASGDKASASHFWKDRNKTLQKANSWTEIQRNLKAGGETMKQHLEDLEERGFALCRILHS